MLPHSSQVLDGGYLIYYLADSYPLVQWCLSHGAHVTYPDADPTTPPLLEVVAKRGSVETFKLLQEHGAPLGKRILHRAVERAAYADTPEKLVQSMEMVRFLVEEVGLDVNGMDAEGRPNFYGTPVNYAAHAGGGKEVVEYLLEVSCSFFCRLDIAVPCLSDARNGRFHQLKVRKLAYFVFLAFRKESIQG